MKGCWLAILVILIFVATPTFALMDPLKTSTMKVEVNENVRVTTTGGVDKLEITLMIPQEDAFQKVESMEVSVPYETVTDSYGNRLIKATINNPGTTAGFAVKTVVSISRRNTAAALSSAFAAPTLLIQSDDREITDLAAAASAGETGDFERAAAVASWVNQNIRYDLNFAGPNVSAKSTLQSKAGVCSGFSALTAAMLRSIGYKAAYEVGYAYNASGGTESHGWVETCSPGGKCFPVDSTWGEAGWLDAAHVKFATVADAYFLEATALVSGPGTKTVKLEPVDVSLKILDSTEEPIISTKASLLDSKIGSGHAVLRADFSADGCAMTKVRYVSCLVEGGKAFLNPEKSENIVYFCDGKTAFMPFEMAAGTESDVIYTCALTAAPSGGERQDITIEIDPREKAGENPGLSVDKTTVKSGETVTANAAGAQLFTDYGAYGTDGLTVTAPAKSFRVYAYRDGALEFQDVTVSATRPIDVTITAPGSVKLGETANVSVEIKNIDTEDRTVSVRVGNESKGGLLAAGKSITYAFEFVPGESDKTVQAFAETEGFSTSASTPISVITPEKNILEQIWEAITEWFNSVFGV